MPQACSQASGRYAQRRKRADSGGMGSEEGRGMREERREHLDEGEERQTYRKQQRCQSNQQTHRPPRYSCETRGLGDA